MATVKEIIDKMGCPDIISVSPAKILARWLGELDHRPYHYPEDADAELLYPNEELYIKYLTAMVDFFSGDFEKYAESAIAFQKEFERMRRYAL